MHRCFSSISCGAGFFPSYPNRVFKFWGNVDASDAHLLVGSGTLNSSFKMALNILHYLFIGATLSFQTTHRRYLKTVGITVQDGGTLEFKSHEADRNDEWSVEVCKMVFTFFF